MNKKENWQNMNLDPPIKFEVLLAFVKKELSLMLNVNNELQITLI